MNSPARHAVAADVVFDGVSLHEDAAVVFEGSTIVRLVARVEAGDIPTTTLPGGLWLVPGFVDLQVNGGGDLLFNDAPTPQTLIAMAAAHRQFGTTSFLPTLITDAPAKTAQAMAAVDAAMHDEPSILGLHLEGPFISPDRAGVHDRRFIRTPTEADVAELTAPRAGALMVTLAPECVDESFIARLTASDVRVSLGHTNATYAQTRAAIGAGARGFTHLFNAMRPLASREGGPIAAALEDSACSFGLIVDGIHVAPAMLRLALRSPSHPMLVTDAMAPVGGARDSFRLYGEDITVVDGRCVRHDGTLAGAFLDMASAVRNAVRLAGASLEQALHYASSAPAAFLGVNVGRLTPGYRADMIALDPKTIAVSRSWVAGRTTGTRRK